METIDTNTLKIQEIESFNFLASLINGNKNSDPCKTAQPSFNFLASLINGNPPAITANSCKPNLLTS